MSVEIVYDPDTAHWDQLANRREARLLLARMNSARRIVESLDSLSHRTDLSPGRIALLVATRREQYVSAVGFEPELRQVIRQHLESVLAGGNESVAATIQDLRLRLRNGCDSSGT